MGFINRTAHSPLPRVIGEYPTEDIELLASYTPLGEDSHASIDIPVGSSFDEQLDHISTNPLMREDYLRLSAARSLLSVIIGNFPALLAPTTSTTIAVVDVHHGDLRDKIPHANTWHSDVVVRSNTLVGTVTSASPTEWLHGDYKITRKNGIVPSNNAKTKAFEPTNPSTRPVISLRDFNIHKRNESFDPNRVFIVAGLFFTS
jgi:hypothetical protein